MKFNSKSIIISFSAFHCLDELEGDFFDAAYWYLFNKGKQWDFNYTNLCWIHLELPPCSSNQTTKVCHTKLDDSLTKQGCGEEKVTCSSKTDYYWMSLLCWWRHRNSTRFPSNASNHLVLFRPSHGWKNTMSVWWWRTTTGQRSCKRQTVEYTVYVVAIYTFCFWRPNDSMTFNTIPRAVKIFWKFCLMFKYKKQTIWSIVCTSSTSSVTKSDLPHHMWYTLWLNAASTHLFSLIWTVHKHLP